VPDQDAQEIIAQHHPADAVIDEEESPYNADVEPNDANQNPHLALLAAHLAEHAAEPASAPLTRDEAVHALITQDDTVRALRDQGSHFDTSDKDAFERNLAEIVAFTNEPKYEASRERLLDAMAKSLEGPQVLNGVKLFPLKPQYVGENVVGFENWSAANRNVHVPGERYELERLNPAAHSTPPPHVEYLTPAQRDSARVYVGSDGLLKSALAKDKLPNGKYIFVVDSEGRLIAANDDPPPGATHNPPGFLHHSSLSNGDPVRMAGQFEIAAGKIVKINNQSGHFRPDADAFKEFLASLSKRGVDLRGATAEPLGFGTRPNGAFERYPAGADPLQDPQFGRARPKDILATMTVPRGGLNRHPVPLPVRPLAGAANAPAAPRHPGENQPIGWSLPPQLRLPVRLTLGGDKSELRLAA
jgi:hypothetical protein